MNPLARFLTAAGRSMTVLRRRNPRLRHLVPKRLNSRIVRAKSYLTRFRALYVPVDHRSRYSTIYHCCVHKTGSQWIKSLLTDLDTFRFCGLAHYHYRTRAGRRIGRLRVTERIIDHPIPSGNIVSPLYISYQIYRGIPQDGPHRVFFVMRDPRDLVISWYFSAKRNHVLARDAVHPLYGAREALSRLSERDGLLYAIDYLEERGRFAALASWAEGGPGDPNVMLIRYEDLVSEEHFSTFRRLFDFLDIRFPDEVLRDLLAAYSFERLSGRKPGSENVRSHLRSGTGGDWRKYFDGPVESRFHDVARDLVEKLGYRT